MGEKSKQLIEAAREGDIDELGMLLAAGAEVNAADNDGWTALMFAGWYGHGDCVEKLLAAGADVEIKERKGRTAANIARKRGYDGVATLIEGFIKARDEKDVLSRVIPVDDGRVSVRRGL